jgi:hypothetical protein
MQYRPIEDLWFGLNIKDITDTEVNWDTDHTDTITSLVKAGVLAKFLDGKLNLAADFDAQGDEPLKWHVGSEYWFNNLLALRLGSDDRNFTFGMTYQQPRWSLDYAYLNHRLEDVHRFSVTLFLDEINRHTQIDRKKRKTPDMLIEQYNRQPKNYKQQELQRKKEIILFKGGKKESVFDTTPELEGMQPVLKTADPEAQIDNKPGGPDIFFDEETQTPPFRYREKKRVTVIRKPDFRGTEFTDDRAAESSEIKKFTKPGSVNPVSLKGDSNLSPIKSSIKSISSIKSLKQSSVPLINADAQTVSKRRKTHVTPEKTKNIMDQKQSIELEKTSQARKDMETIKTAATKFNGTEAGFLTNIHQLTGKYLKKVPIDPWGSQYKIEALNGILRSAGPDRAYNTKDDLINYYIDEINF